MAKILVVDDDKAFLETIRDLLLEDGHEVLIASNGTEGMSTFESALPDLVILDMLLPGMSGFDCAQAIRGLSQGRTTPFLFVSGFYKQDITSNEARQRFNSADYLVKPFDQARLRGAVRKALGLSDAPLVETPAAPTRDIPPSGRLFDNTVASLLLQASRERRSGILDVMGTSQRARHFLYRGTAVMAQSSRPDLNLGMALVKLGQASPEDLRALLAHVARHGVGLRQAVAAVKPLDEGVVKNAYRELIPSIIAATVAIDGTYQWRPGEEFARYIPLASVAVPGAVHQGIACAPVADLQLHLGPRAELRLVPGPRWEEGVQLSQTELPAADVLPLVDGVTPIGVILEQAQNPQQLQRRMAQIFMLMVTDAVGLSEHDVLVSVPRPQPKAEVRPAAATRQAPAAVDAQPVRPDVAPPAAAPRAAAPAGPPRAAAPTEAPVDLEADQGMVFTPEEQAARKKILAKQQALQSQDYYEIFGLKPESFNAGELKKSYFAIAREFHSDAYAGLQLGSASRTLEAVFSTISEAYEVLSNPIKREEYDAKQSFKDAGITTDVEKVFRAERLSDRAAILADRGEFTTALRELEEAMRLNPQPQVEAWFLYCGFRARGAQPVEGRDAIERLQVLMKDAHISRGNEFIGVIYRFLDDPKKAKLFLRRAQEEPKPSPNVERELRLLTRREQERKEKEKPKGLAGLFKGR